MATSKRSEALVRAAQARAIIGSIFGNNQNQELTAEQVFLTGQKHFNEFGYDTDKILRLLKYTASSGQLQTFKHGRAITFAHLNYAPVVERGGDQEHLEAPSVVKNKRQPAPLQVDFVKATGRVRITLHGMVIEIGVADK